MNMIFKHKITLDRLTCHQNQLNQIKSIRFCSFLFQWCLLCNDYQVDLAS